MERPALAENLHSDDDLPSGDEEAPVEPGEPEPPAQADPRGGAKADAPDELRGSARMGLARQVVSALAEELSRPRARLRRALRRARDGMRSHPLASAALVAALAGALFLLYATGVGVAHGAAAWAAFLGAFLALTVAAPLLLVYAWPAVVAGAAGLLLWGALELGAGAVWLWVATASAFFIVYFASVEMAPLVGAGVLAVAALELGRAPGIAVFVPALALFYWARRRLAASILAAAWAGLAGSAAAQVAWFVLGRVCRETGDPASTNVPPEWLRGALPGPGGLALWIAAATVLAAVLVWRRPGGRDATGPDLE
jgi:hypothetical protein